MMFNSKHPLLFFPLTPLEPGHRYKTGRVHVRGPDEFPAEARTPVQVGTGPHERTRQVSGGDGGSQGHRHETGRVHARGPDEFPAGAWIPVQSVC